MPKVKKMQKKETEILQYYHNGKQPKVKTRMQKEICKKSSWKHAAIV